MRKTRMFLWLQTKRLYKKPAFLGILLLIPLLVLSFGMAARQESGIVTVALYVPEEAAAVRPLLESQLIRYLPCASQEQAEDRVRYGKADAAWCFPEDLQERLEAFCQSPKTAKPPVQVLQREDSALLRLAREKLSGALMVLASPVLYEQFAEKQGLEGDLSAFYEGAAPEMDLFHFATAETALPVTYLTAPVRGLLAVVLVVAALAAAMFWNADLQKGTFGTVPQTKLPLLEAGCQLVCLGNVGLATLIALLASGMALLRLQELSAMGLYMLCCGSFAMVLRGLLPNNRWLGGILAALTVVLIGVCPVFLDLGFLSSAQLLLPPTYYIRSLSDPQYLGFMTLYSLACTALWLLLQRGRKWKN